MASFFAAHRAAPKILAIGRNYALHAKEMGASLPKRPVVFLKPSSSIVEPSRTVHLPASIGDIHHEVELGVVIGREMRNVDERAAMQGVAGFLCAVDLTAREEQAAAKAGGLPWTVSKGRDGFCPLGDVMDAASIPHPDRLSLRLTVDGHVKQEGHTSDMVFSVPYLVSFLSTVMTLREHDIILTGTPAGVGPVAPGQRVEAEIRCPVTGTVMRCDFDVAAE